MFIDHKKGFVFAPPPPHAFLGLICGGGVRLGGWEGNNGLFYNRRNWWGVRK